jgi:hypothetical protein
MRSKFKGETMHRKIAMFASVILSLTAIAACQADRPSPPESASCQLGAGNVMKTDYSSPRRKGRKIYGGLVPYGHVWRTGANEATTFVTNIDLNVGDKVVPAGSYTLFTVPNPDKWTLIINKKTGEWGIPYKYESDELARIDMKVSKLPSRLENFTINYEGSGKTCTMEIDWENTRASVEITAK